MRKNFVMLGVASLTVASVWGTGCLEVRGGLAREADTVGSTDTAGSDVAETTAPDVDLCAGKSCDDGNPCTEDHCSSATGTCEHLTVGAGAAMPAEPYECINASACDDGNPCTIDACNIRQCSAGGYCTHAANPECAVGCSSGCDAGNPCTDDACVGAACEHAVLAECDPQCTSAGLLPVRNAWLVPWGSAVKALGTVQMERISSLSCMDHGLCNCWGAPVLEGFMSELALYVTNQDETAMSCRSHDAPGPGSMGATTDVTCEPMAAAVNYRVWGIGGGAGPTPSAGAPGTQPLPPPRIQGIAVEGYCLDTADLALTGRYQMFFERWGETAELKAEIAIDEPGWLYLHVQGALCANCPPIDTWSVLEVLDNGIRFKFDAQFDDMDRGVIVRLASVANALTGRWVLENYAAGPAFTLSGPAAGDAPSGGAGSASTPAPADSDGMVDPYYQGGALRLIRLPGESPRSPCEWTP